MKKRGNGQGTAFKRGSDWTAQITWKLIKDDDGKIIKRSYKSKGGFKTKREALSYIPTLRNEPIGIDNNILFSKLYEIWSMTRFEKVTKSTSDGYKSAYAKCEVLYMRKFGDLKTADLQKVIDDCEWSRRTKADIKSLFSNLYSYAIENDYVSKDYSQYVKLPKKPKSKKDAFSAEEREKIWAEYHNGNEIAGHILVMIYTGMRYGEITTIKKENVHLDKHYLIGGIKSNAGINRTIPIADLIMPIVTEMYDNCDNKLLEIPQKKWYTLYYAMLKQIGVRNLNPHCCRHTCATALAEAGIPPAIIVAIMGHEDYQTTLGYTHIPLDDLINSINKI